MLPDLVFVCSMSECSIRGIFTSVLLLEYPVPVLTQPDTSCVSIEPSDTRYPIPDAAVLSARSLIRSFARARLSIVVLCRRSCIKTNETNGRCYRFGQTKPVQVLRLVMGNKSLEQKMHNKQVCTLARQYVCRPLYMVVSLLASSSRVDSVFLADRETQLLGFVLGKKKSFKRGGGGGFDAQHITLPVRGGRRVQAMGCCIG